MVSVISIPSDRGSSPQRSSSAAIARKVEVDQVADRQVDRHREVDAVVAPLPALLERGAQHMVCQRVDEAYVLGEMDELEGADQPALGVLPADQGLHAAHAPVEHRRLRPVVDDDLAAVERMAQLTDQCEPLGRMVVRRRVVDLEGRAGVLGDVHRDLGMLEQGGDVVPVVGVDGDADARPDFEQNALKDERCGKRRADTGGKLDGRRLLHDPRHEDRELVASEPGEGVAGSQHAPQARGHRRDHLVTRVVPERVVDLAEAVDIHEHDGRLDAVPPGRRIARVVTQTHTERLPVGEDGHSSGRRSPSGDLERPVRVPPLWGRTATQMRAVPALEGGRSASGRARPEERAVEVDVELDGREPVWRRIHCVAVGREPMARTARLPRAAHEPVLAVLGLPHPLAL